MSVTQSGRCTRPPDRYQGGSQQPTQVAGSDRGGSVQDPSHEDQETDLVHVEQDPSESVLNNNSENCEYQNRANLADPHPGVGEDTTVEDQPEELDETTPPVQNVEYGDLTHIIKGENSI